MTSEPVHAMPASNALEKGERPGLAIIANSHTPYRLHLHRRIAAEIPEIRLWSVFTHEQSNAPWGFHVPAEIGPISFGEGESSAVQDSPRRAAHEWRKGGRIIEWMRRTNVRAAVVMGYNDPARLRIIRWCHRQGLPCYLFGDSNIRGDRAAGLKALAKRWLVTRVVKACTGVLPCGTLGAAYFAKYGAVPERTFCFPYEPDYDLIRRLTAQEIEAARQRFKLRPDRRLVLFSGRLAQPKRPDLLLDAFAAIARERPEWDLLVVGDGPLRSSLGQRVPEALRHRIVWAGFLDDQRTVSALYRASDVLVLPSDYEPWAVVVNEAAAAGLAIIASDVVGAAAELVRDGVNGRTFPAGDLAALTAALLDATAPARIDLMKVASAGVLDDWRRRGDPIDGLRRALAVGGIL